jgi:uncharacterized membrane protein (DUF106 family)
MHAMLGPAATILPFSALMLLLAGTTGLSSAVLSVKLRSQERMDRLQERMAELRERLEAARKYDDEDAIEELQTEQQELTVEYLAAMKTQLCPAVWSMLVSLPVFLRAARAVCAQSAPSGVSAVANAERSTPTSASRSVGDS